jgi:UV DNA damage endonuclease
LSIRFGYACLNVTLGKKGGFRSMIKRTWQQKGIQHASLLALDNVRTLHGIVQWNHTNGIPAYRMSSDMVPWASEYELDQLPDWPAIRDEFEQVGKLALQTGQRISFHPGQFNCLTSPHEHVIKNCVRDLRIHGEIMDIMGLPRTPQSKINIHLGGVFGEKDKSIDRWCKNVDLLPESVRSRLTVENDDKASCYSVVDLHRVWQRTRTPIVFDYHHHKFCTGGLTEEEALRMAVSTWPEGIRPMTHYSESASTREGRDVAQTAHSNFVDGPVNDYGLDIDCMIEAKAKELAVLQLTTGKRYEDFFDESRGFTNEEYNERVKKEKEKKKAAKSKKLNAA